MKIITQKEILDRYNTIVNNIETAEETWNRRKFLIWSKKLDKFKSEVKDICEHPIFNTSKFDHDDGYGRWAVLTVLTCLICNAKNKYGRWYK